MSQLTNSVQDKIEVRARLSKTNAYITIPFDTYTFADGSIRVKIDENKDVKLTNIENISAVIVNAYITSMDDLMIIAQLKDIISRIVRGYATFRLNINSPAYSRYDRVMHENKCDSFGALVFSNFIKSMNFDKVTFKDCHSDVLIKLLGGNDRVSYSSPVENITQSTCVSAVEPRLKNKFYFTTIVPDKGALLKVVNSSKDIEYDENGEIMPGDKLDDQYVVFDKVRNPETGKIESIKPIFNEEVLSRKVSNFVVIDDLCEGGGTFLGIADIVRNKMLKGSTLSLYVTHGLFTHNAIDKLLKVYDHIYAYQMQAEMYRMLPKNQKARMTVANLIQY